MGESITVDTGRERIAGTFLGLDDGGALALRDAQGLRAHAHLRRCDAGARPAAAERALMARAAASQRDKAAAGELVFMALGGIGEIGMNCYLYGLGPADARQWLMVDLGITFPEGENDPGVDVILPDLRFIEEERGALAGLVLTHAHEDHIGAVIELWPRLKVPIYATPFTAAMLKAKLAEFGGKLQLPIKEVAARRPLQGRAVRSRAHLRGALDPGVQRPRHPHAARHRAAHRRLEDRRHAADRRRRPTRPAQASSAPRA